MRFQLGSSVHGQIQLARPSRILALMVSYLAQSAYAQGPVQIPWADCFTGANVNQRLNVTSVYAQLFGEKSLNVTILGESSGPIRGQVNDSSNLATLFTSSETLTFSTWMYSSYLCDTLRPPSPLPTPDPQGSYCPIPAGPFALSATVPWGTGRNFITQYTRVHAVDPYTKDLFCVDISTTPLGPVSINSQYGTAHSIFWVSICLTITYWLLVATARIVSALSRGSRRTGSSRWSRVESAGFIVASALSGERLATSPGLMRFCTPSARDIVFHSQWCAALSMVAVQWPPFIYPILTQMAWSTLSYNITFTQGSDSPAIHWDPRSVPVFDPPSNFADQMKDPSSPIHIDTTLANTLFTLPNGTQPGISSFAYAVGLQPSDLFGICLGLFLSIVAGTIAISVLLWLVDWLAVAILSKSNRSVNYPTLGTGKDDAVGQPSPNDARSSPFNLRTGYRASSRKNWWKSTPDFTLVHGSALGGNLVRLLIWFHFPITIFSCYQLALGTGRASKISIALAALSFLFISLLLPIFLVLRVSTKSTSKLYDQTKTLLFLGPLYNHYRHGSQLFACLLFATNAILGITIGFGQGSGTAQAVIILIVEVVSALVTSIWLPWAAGASMSLTSFLFCVGKIIVAVLLIIMTPAISIGNDAGGWVAYGVLLILAIIYLAIAMLLLVKLTEAALRIYGRIQFGEVGNSADNGIYGVSVILGCCRSRRRNRALSGRRRYRATNISRDNSSEVSSYLPPAGPNALAPSSASQHSAPVSVLRPEQALRPYREDSDDETGYIMGAWPPFPQADSRNISATASTSGAVHPTASMTSGFSKVGGGRAHYDAPYAIAGVNSSIMFPANSGRNPPVSSSPRHDQFNDEATASVTNIARQPQKTNTALPAGDAFAHTRTKSHTAIVELAAVTPDANLLQVIEPAGPANSKNTRRPSSAGNADITLEDQSSKKKNWYHNLKMSRRHSDGSEALARQVATMDDPPLTGSSFVVLRDKRRAPHQEPNSSNANS